MTESVWSFWFFHSQECKNFVVRVHDLEQAVTKIKKIFPQSFKESSQVTFSQMYA